MLSLTPINRDEALRYMGFKGTVPDEAFLNRIDTLEETLIKSARPAFTWRCLPLERTDCSLKAGGVKLMGASIAQHLEGCDRAVFMAATASAETDILISRAEARDMTDALILDALGSAAAEQVCAMAETEIREKLRGFCMTRRFSPGYGDFPIDTQKNIAEVLSVQKRIGVTVTDSCLLIPSKSVTAVIGVSESPVPRKRMGCEFCTMKNKCNFRQNGVHC